MTAAADEEEKPTNYQRPVLVGLDNAGGAPVQNAGIATAFRRFGPLASLCNSPIAMSILTCCAAVGMPPGEWQLWAVWGHVARRMEYFRLAELIDFQPAGELLCESRQKMNTNRCKSFDVLASARWCRLSGKWSPSVIGFSNFVGSLAFDLTALPKISADLRGRRRPSPLSTDPTTGRSVSGVWYSAIWTSRCGQTPGVGVFRCLQ